MMWVTKGKWPTVRGNPAPAGYIGNGEAVTDEEPMRRLSQVGIHGAIEATGLIVVAVNGVLNLLRCVSWKHPVSI